MFSSVAKLLFLPQAQALANNEFLDLRQLRDTPIKMKMSSNEMWNAHRRGSSHDPNGEGSVNSGMHDQDRAEVRN